ncbi:MULTISPECIES: low molecular weight protein-tyrosine-phosphatase [Undibacterium]|jgi:protein-tyrosine phosphatase|uniref:protein-tyrosine-phosphatase n=2 Tax=Undibacterium TaxID=401469 RepID=A0ABS5GXH6_9BURK|nr:MULTISPECIES: low molecular weight protein-tyrosine-phosphatase [Undibacterium]MBY0570982.1 low molecular weight phosphotyrosine protein phosphatase [Burkholderiaceae bacterium]MBC3810000.1 low molecular weight phosphotyrosine protein phosphatase [Undibacterium aquatile]MBC3877484.1 low molecular weight phosphotyrosine protein phosphatase [Undibacterium sp. FT79W]MBC3926772.1 low molecular weight phosphotyrosine protein phosphatase [Undibacterium sp. CY21W]MBR7791153.1 low molecular weight 
MNPPKVTSILFICMGNICRSPTAEGVFRAKAKAAGISEQLVIDSAGTHAYHIGEPPDARSHGFAVKRGFDLSQQRARQIKAEDFVNFDLLLAMDKSNLALLQAACPEPYQHKLDLLMHYAQHTQAEEVPDPYYGGVSGFDLVLDYIEDASEGLVARLQK